MRTVVLVLLLLVSATTSLVACSLTAEPIARLAPTEYVFTGIVSAASEEVLASGRTTAAVMIEDVNVIHAPARRRSYNIVVTQLGSDCSDVTIRAADVLRRVSVGSKVAVVAIRSAHADRLQVQIGGLTSISDSSQPDAGFRLRQQLAILSSERDESVRVAILRTLISDVTGDLDFGRAVKLYAPRRYRRHLLQEYADYWSRWQ